MRANLSAATEAMFNSRVFWLIGLLGTGCLAQAAGTNQWVTLGKYQVHPTRILVKVKSGVLPDLDTEAARQNGSIVHRRVQLVPGLTVLEEAKPVALATVSANDEETQRTRLLDRIAALKQS